MMTLQTVLIRLGGVSFGSSQFTFSMVVAVFVLCIALGSFAVSALPRIPAFLLPACLVAPAPAAGRALHASPTPGRTGRTRCARSTAITPRASTCISWWRSLGVLLVLALPVALSGAVLPLMFHALRDRVGDLGDAAGRLYSWNTLGSLLGALIGGYALLFWLDLHHTFRIAMAAIALAAALMTWQRSSLGRAAPAVMLVARARRHRDAPGLARRISSPPAPFASATRSPTPLPVPKAFFTSYRQGAMRFYDDDPVASVAVKTFDSADGVPNLAIITNGKSDGAIPGDSVTTILLALIPALLAREPAQHASWSDYGTGVTAGELAALEEVRKVTVAEISPGVIEAAPLFDFGNLGRLQEPEGRDRARRRLPDAAAQRGRDRPDRLRAEQPLGDRHRDALQPRVPGGGARPSDTRAVCTRSGSTATRPTTRRSRCCCAPISRCSRTRRSGSRWEPTCC